MKIIYLHQYFNKPNMPGGTRSYEMAVRMVKKGHEVHIITSKRDGNFSKSQWKEERFDGIIIHWGEIPYNNRMRFFNRLKAFFKFAFSAGAKAIDIGGDIVFATSTPLTIAIPAVIAKRKLKVPMVFEVRDLWPELPIAIGAIRNPLLKYCASQLEKWAYKNSESIIGLSPQMCNSIEKLSGKKNSVHNVPNCSDISLFQEKKIEVENFKNKHKWIKNKQLVIYAGTLGKINGVGYLVEIAQIFLKLNKNVNFLIVGDGLELELIKNKANQLNCLNKNFFMINQLKKADMPAVFNASTISTSLFLPVKEMEANSANKFFDTLAAGKPIVINYGGWQKDLIEKYKIGIVLNSDIKKSAVLLNKLLLDNARLNRMGVNSGRLAKSKFSRDSLADKLINVLETCV